MNIFARVSLATTILAVLCGCSAQMHTFIAAPPVQTQHRLYKGTASVGDFLSISLDSTAQTISYVNLSNGDRGTVPYTVNGDRSYTLNDPTGNLVAAYEIPNYALIIQAAKTGPTHNTPSLITAVESGPITMATFEGHSYNYMQFRTAAGGIEVGSVTLDANGNISGQSYWPYGAFNGSGPFNTMRTMPGTDMREDVSGTFLTMTNLGSTDYIFGTANGQFAVDTGNGAILGLQQASTKAFDPAVAGTYKAIYYQKTGASTGLGNVEAGNASLSSSTIVIDASGDVVVKDSLGNPILNATLTPVADASYLVGPGKLTDPCFGVFTFRVTTRTSQQDVFMTFRGRAVLFSAFTQPVPAPPGSTYDYIYGVALH